MLAAPITCLPTLRGPRRDQFVSTDQHGGHLQVKGVTYRQLNAELQSLDRRIEQAWQDERKNVLQDIRELMTHWDITANELRRYRRGTYHTKPVVPK